MAHPSDHPAKENSLGKRLPPKGLVVLRSTACLGVAIAVLFAFRTGFRLYGDRVNRSRDYFVDTFTMPADLSQANSHMSPAAREALRDSRAEHYEFVNDPTIQKAISSGRARAKALASILGDMLSATDESTVEEDANR